MKGGLVGETSMSEAGSLKKGFFQSTFYKSVLIIIKLSIGMALLFVAVRGIQWASVAEGIRSANLTWLILVILSVLLGLSLKLWRWAFLVKNYHLRVGISRLFSAYFVSQAANIIMPFRSGELVRVGYFASDSKVLPEILSTIVLEKYLDLIALTVSAILVSLKFSLDNVLNLRGLLIPVALMLTVLLMLFILLGTPAWRRIRLWSLPDRFAEWVDGWVRTSEWLRTPQKVLPAVLLTVLIWAVMWSTNLLLFAALGISLTGTAAGVVLVLVYIGLLPALMPGNIGPFYFFASLALLPFGIIHADAFLFAVVLHAIVTLPPLLCGVIGLSLRSEGTIKA